MNGTTIYKETQNLIGAHPTGFGTITYANGDLFDGFFRNGQPLHGKMIRNGGNEEIVGQGPGTRPFPWKDQ
ncbi:hypothetical protein FACS189472_12310 [Alphaproteobacteria bacterium]|nr:hypothetical protein FACS189472_12310 [Alphaproteobacteria bacterium]